MEIFIFFFNKIPRLIGICFCFFRLLRKSTKEIGIEVFFVCVGIDSENKDGGGKYFFDLTQSQQHLQFYPSFVKTFFFCGTVFSKCE